VTVEEQDGRLYFDTPPPWANPAAKALNDEIRAMVGRKWHPDRKQWSISICKRNQISLQYLLKDAPNPFENFEKPIQHFQSKRALWPHQADILDFILTKHCCIVAGEQGIGKTLPLIEVGELLNIDPENYWYVGTVASIEAVHSEYSKWEASVCPSKFVTYERLTKIVEKWDDKNTVPRILIGDESSRLKSETSQRAVAFKFLADAVREVWGEEAFVILLSGTPAPKDPTDWWMQSEIVAPGFLKEGSKKILSNTLCHINYDNQNAAGQSFPQISFWWDDENRCQHCGKLLDLHEETTKQCLGHKDKKGRPTYYTKSVNEVERLYKRLAPITIVKRKVDCLSLPPKHYRQLWCDTPDEIKTLANNILDTAVSGVEAYIQLRELSDGFLYRVETTDKLIKCKRCGGTGIIKTPNGVVEDSYLDAFQEESEEDFDYTESIEFGVDAPLEETSCPECNGTGQAYKILRVPQKLRSPKLDKLEAILEDHEETGRLVVFAAFHASIDRLQEFFLKRLWTVFQVDGRGWFGITPAGERIEKSDMLRLFQDPEREMEKVVWLGHPKSSGMGITLTASPTAVYFSNSFNGEDRIQSEDRIHRGGMDENRGATIIDLFNLKTDQMILENLKNKIRLQNITLGAVKEAILGEYAD